MDFTQTLMDVLNIGPGSGLAHTADEYSNVDDLPKAAALLKEIVEGLERGSR